MAVHRLRRLVPRESLPSGDRPACRISLITSQPLIPLTPRTAPTPLPPQPSHLLPLSSHSSHSSVPPLPSLTLFILILPLFTKSFVILSRRTHSPCSLMVLHPSYKRCNKSTRSQKATKSGRGRERKRG